MLRHECFLLTRSGSVRGSSRDLQFLSSKFILSALSGWFLAKILNSQSFLQSFSVLTDIDMWVLKWPWMILMTEIFKTCFRRGSPDDRGADGGRWRKYEVIFLNHGSSVSSDVVERYRHIAKVVRTISCRLGWRRFSLRARTHHRLSGNKDNFEKSEQAKSLIFARSMHLSWLIHRELKFS